MRPSAKAHLVFSFRKILRPLVKILIRAGVSYDEFREVVKATYIEVGVRDGVGQGVPVTRARVAGATGVPKHEVDRYVDDPALLAPPGPTNAAIIAEVLHLWNTDAKYLGPYGVPLEIDFESTPGKNLTELVHRADPMADPLVILEELLESGILVRVGDRYLKITARAFVLVDGMSPQMLEHMGNVMTNLANTLQYNMRGPTTPKRIERVIFADNGLDPDSMTRFEEFADERVKAFIRDVDDWLGKNTNTYLDQQSVVQTGLSIFHYVNEPARYEDLREIIREVPDMDPANSRD
jgi:hypothetical protein